MSSPFLKWSSRTRVHVYLMPCPFALVKKSRLILIPRIQLCVPKLPTYAALSKFLCPFVVSICTILWFPWRWVHIHTSPRTSRATVTIPISSYMDEVVRWISLQALDTVMSSLRLVSYWIYNVCGWLSAIYFHWGYTTPCARSNGFDVGSYRGYDADGRQDNWLWYTRCVCWIELFRTSSRECAEPELGTSYEKQLGVMPVTTPDSQSPCGSCDNASSLMFYHTRYICSPAKESIVTAGVMETEERVASKTATINIHTVVQMLEQLLDNCVNLIVSRGRDSALSQTSTSGWCVFRKISLSTVATVDVFLRCVLARQCGKVSKNTHRPETTLPVRLSFNSLHPGKRAWGFL